MIVAFDRLVENSIEDLKGVRERYGDDKANQLLPLVYDIDKAQPTPLDPDEFFYCPNIIKTDYYGNVYYDAEWKPNDENCGTTVPYWYALMEPVHGRRNKPEDFKKVNGGLFPNGMEVLDIYEWTTDWSDLFDAGHEWYGACCWSIYDKSMNRYVVMAEEKQQARNLLHSAAVRIISIELNRQRDQYGESKSHDTPKAKRRSQLG